jgi:hypothetical protein
MERWVALRRMRWRIRKDARTYDKNLVSAFIAYSANPYLPLWLPKGYVMSQSSVNKSTQWRIPSRSNLGDSQDVGILVEKSGDLLTFEQILHLVFEGVGGLQALILACRNFVASSYTAEQ